MPRNGLYLHITTTLHATLPNSECGQWEGCCGGGATFCLLVLYLFCCFQYTIYVIRNTMYLYLVYWWRIRCGRVLDTLNGMMVYVCGCLPIRKMKSGNVFKYMHVHTDCQAIGLSFDLKSIKTEEERFCHFSFHRQSIKIYRAMVLLLRSLHLCTFTPPASPHTTHTHTHLLPSRQRDLEPFISWHISALGSRRHISRVCIVCYCIDTTACSVSIAIKYTRHHRRIVC